MTHLLQLGIALTEAVSLTGDDRQNGRVAALSRLA